MAVLRIFSVAVLWPGQSVSQGLPLVESRAFHTLDLGTPPVLINGAMRLLHAKAQGSGSSCWSSAPMDVHSGSRWHFPLLSIALSYF